MENSLRAFRHYFGKKKSPKFWRTSVLCKGGFDLRREGQELLHANSFTSINSRNQWKLDRKSTPSHSQHKFPFVMRRQPHFLRSMHLLIKFGASYYSGLLFKTVRETPFYVNFPHSPFYRLGYAEVAIDPTQDLRKPNIPQRPILSLFCNITVFIIFVLRHHSVHYYTGFSTYLL